MTATRRDDLAASLDALRHRIADACTAAGRDPAEVELLPVTKSIPAIDIALLVDLGLSTFGENRVQDGAVKAAELALLRPATPVRWHLVGRLQRNKVRAVVPWVARVESVDSQRLAVALDSALGQAVAAGTRQGPLAVLLQLSVDGDPRRGGVTVDGLLPLAAHVQACPHLALAGLMAVAPLGAEPDRAFAEVAAAVELLRREHPEASVMSAGMSADLEAAIRHGSTCVRVGTALLPKRPLASR